MTTYFKTLVVDLSSTYGFITVTGKDAEHFLQGQLTSDIRQITPTTHGLSAYCNLKGRIRALFKLFFYQEHYYLQCPLSILNNTLNTLQKYARFSKVELFNASSKWDLIGISIQPIDLSTTNDTLLTYIAEQNIFKDILYCSSQKKPLSSSKLMTLPEGLWVLSLPDRYARFTVIGPPHAIEALRQNLKNKAINDINNIYATGDFEAWKFLEIKAGIPEIWPQTVEKFLPHSLNLPALGAVSFNKGCYCGQEIIARMEYRANLKRHLFRAALERTHTISEIPAGTLLKSKQPVDENAGMVVTTSQVAPNKIEILAETQDLYMAQPDNLFVTLEDQDLPLIIEQKFLDTNKK
jgi:folate-binding protein YgfZ